MTNTAAPERATKIPASGDRVIILRGMFDGHMATIERIGLVGNVDVRVDVTGQLQILDRAELVYPTGEHLETYDQQKAREMRARTLARLHSHTRNLRPVMAGREAAITMMAARYGAAERLKGGDTFDIDLAYSAASRRFGALQRLVYGD